MTDPWARYPIWAHSNAEQRALDRAERAAHADEMAEWHVEHRTEEQEECDLMEDRMERAWWG